MQGESDDLGRVVRGHIYVEHELNLFIAEAVFDPEDADRVAGSYSAKIKLAVLLGLKPEWGAPLSALGQLRNDFAHEFAAKLDNAAVNRLYQAMPEAGRTVARVSFDRTREKFRTGDKTTFDQLNATDRFTLLLISIKNALKGTTYHMQNGHRAAVFAHYVGGAIRSTYYLTFEEAVMAWPAMLAGQGGGEMTHLWAYFRSGAYWELALGVPPNGFEAVIDPPPLEVPGT